MERIHLIIKLFTNAYSNNSVQNLPILIHNWFVLQRTATATLTLTFDNTKEVADSIPLEYTWINLKL